MSERHRVRGVGRRGPSDRGGVLLAGGRRARFGALAECRRSGIGEAVHRGAAGECPVAEGGRVWPGRLGVVASGGSIGAGGDRQHGAARIVGNEIGGCSGNGSDGALELLEIDRIGRLDAGGDTGDLPVAECQFADGILWCGNPVCGVVRHRAARRNRALPERDIGARDPGCDGGALAEHHGVGDGPVGRALADDDGVSAGRACAQPGREAEVTARAALETERGCPVPRGCRLMPDRRRGHCRSHGESADRRCVLLGRLRAVAESGDVRGKAGDRAGEAGNAGDSTAADSGGILVVGAHGGAGSIGCAVVGPGLDSGAEADRDAVVGIDGRLAADRDAVDGSHVDIGGMAGAARVAAANGDRVGAGRRRVRAGGRRVVAGNTPGTESGGALGGSQGAEAHRRGVDAGGSAEPRHARDRSGAERRRIRAVGQNRGVHAIAGTGDSARVDEAARARCDRKVAEGAAVLPESAARHSRGLACLADGGRLSVGRDRCLAYGNGVDARRNRALAEGGGVGRVGERGLTDGRGVDLSARRRPGLGAIADGKRVGVAERIGGRAARRRVAPDGDVGKVVAGRKGRKTERDIGARHAVGVGKRTERQIVAAGAAGVGIEAAGGIGVAVGLRAVAAGSVGAVGPRCPRARADCGIVAVVAVGKTIPASIEMHHTRSCTVDHHATQIFVPALRDAEHRRFAISSATTHPSGASLTRCSTA